MPIGGLEVESEYADGVLVLRLAGELDVSTVEEFRRRAEESISMTRPRAVLLSCRRLSFLDSSGLGVILGRFRRLQERGVRMVTAGATGRVKTVLELSGVGELIPLYDSERKAIDALQEVG